MLKFKASGELSALAYLLHASSGCELEDDLGGLLVEVAAIATQADGLAFHLIAEGVEQSLHPAHDAAQAA